MKNFRSTLYTTYDIRYTGFTLIELLVVISIIGLLIGLSIFGLQGARKSARDAVRKSALEEIRSGVGIYKADCNKYPVSNPAKNPLTAFGTSLKGDGVSSSACLVSNIYINKTPVDPSSPNSDFLYWSDGVTYQICATLEQNVGGATVTCGGSSSCGSATCNYKVENP
ncbi:MAG TPA: prepilin-type N-terminal cleavage/methylation domain-containing protein [Patescibacteria group bacterium]|nr:prepilin-type N-terminal cleavage/methylation domain-containing protein [Patescibacteria group bacterium]